MTKPEIVLARHGETEWSRDMRHTGRTDVPLTDRGRDQARALAPKLAGRELARVLTSPLSRARETCELAGLGDRAEPRPELVELDYGDAEGLTTEQIRERDPGWTVWTHPTPGAETFDQVEARLRPLIAELPAGRRRRRDLRPRTHPARAVGALDRHAAPGRLAPRAGHRRALRARLGARDAGDPGLERLISRC